MTVPSFPSDCPASDEEDDREAFCAEAEAEEDEPCEALVP